MHCDLNLTIDLATGAIIFAIGVWGWVIAHNLNEILAELRKR